MTHLDGQLSPYLLAHRDNPIDWYPWGEDAFMEARRRDVPVLISIGYHTCHWCHVMARESFSDPEVARRVNESFVAIKVDREEHPEVDQHYLTRAGAFIEKLGWPLTIFATPDGDTFHAATYLPPQPRGDIPSFLQTVQAVSDAWTQQRETVATSAESVREAIRLADIEAKKQPALTLSADDWESIISDLLAQEDERFGGFGQAPKFPIVPVLEFLLCAGSGAGRELAQRTLAQVAASDLRDPVEGGFFRYSTNQDWTIPHYERMLSDNALLLWCYAEAGQREVASGIVSFLRNVMRTPGGFASAQDSESVIEGSRMEGEYYRRSASQRARLEPPPLDDKVLAGWTGLALRGLARAGLRGVSGDPVGLGLDVADEILSIHLSDDGQLARMSRSGRVSPARATLEDYGGLGLGLIELGLVAGRTDLISQARNFVDRCLTDTLDFVVPGGGDPTIGALDAVTGDVSEGATPSGRALIAMAALQLSQLFGDSRYREAAEHAVTPYAHAVRLRTLGFGGLAGVLWQLGEGGHELVVVESGRHTDLSEVAREYAPPGWLVLTTTTAGAAEMFSQGVDLLAGRCEQDQSMAYVCHGRVCDRPHTDATALREALNARD